MTAMCVCVCDGGILLPGVRGSEGWREMEGGGMVKRGWGVGGSIFISGCQRGDTLMNGGV